MPFQTTAIAPPMNPRVTIGFSGLMVLRPGANNTCEVGIHRFNSSHECRVTLIVRRPDRPAIMVPMLKGPLEAPFTIRLNPEPNPAVGDFKVFAPTPEPFVRTASTNHPLDHRWAVNVRHIHPLATLNDGVQPLLTLKTGILYTPSLTSSGLEPKFKRSGIADIELKRLASNLAVAIITPVGSFVEFNWRDLGNSMNFALPRREDPPNTTYNVCFTNEPPGLNAEPHDEMLLYYRILEENGMRVQPNQRFSLQYTNPLARTDEIPCLSLIQNP